jgi:bacterioferritin (cytochrome b1)
MDHEATIVELRRQLTIVTRLAEYLDADLRSKQEDIASLRRIIESLQAEGDGESADI